MREKRFVAARRERWDALDALVRRVDRRGYGALRAEDAQALAFAYRAVTSDLAAARARGYDPVVVRHLESLAARAHAAVYASTARPGWSRAVDFLARVFPAEVRRSWAPIAACIALTLVAAFIAGEAVRRDPANAYALLPASAVRPVDGPLHDTNFGFDRAFSPAMSAQIVTNNVRVAAVAAAGGATAGILTVVIILFNGLYLGAYGALFARAGYGADFWATIAPHGVIELTAIQIAGGAGLLIAGGIVRPGRLRRGDALARAGRRAGRLVLGVAMMLTVAATIEGFISPQRLPIPVRAAIGALTALALIGYLGFAGRSNQAARLDLEVGIERGNGEASGRDVDDENPVLA